MAKSAVYVYILNMNVYIYLASLCMSTCILHACVQECACVHITVCTRVYILVTVLFNNELALSLLTFLLELMSFSEPRPH